MAPCGLSNCLLPSLAACSRPAVARNKARRRLGDTGNGSLLFYGAVRLFGVHAQHNRVQRPNSSTR